MGPYRWSLVTGSVLPTGLLLHQDGTVSGTPAFAQTSQIRVQVADAAQPQHTTTAAFTLTIVASPAADLKVTAVHQGSFVSGRLGSYRLTVTNTGNAATGGPMTVIFNRPSGLTYTGATGSGWVCSQAGSTVTCTRRASLAPAASSSLVVAVRVRALHGTTLTFTWTVSPTDHTPGDNTAIDRVTVR